METTTTFDLNHAMQQWRENLGQSPAFRGENLAELESHLRDAVAGLEGRGLSSEEAFMVACRRIGKASSLETEFGKVNRGTVWLDRLLWMLIGLQLWQLISGPVGMISKGVVSLGLTAANFNFASYGLTIPVALFALAHLLAFVGSLTICWWLVVSRGESFALRIERFLNGWSRLGLIGGVLCLLSWAVSALSSALWPLSIKFTNPLTIGEILTSQSYSGAFAWFIQSAALILLTLILARKRLQFRRHKWASTLRSSQNSG